MPEHTRIAAPGLKQLTRDLRAIDRSLPSVVGTALARGADPIIVDAKIHAPRGTAPIPATRTPRKRLADTIRARRRGLNVAIAARGPHAKTIHDGGRHPLFGDRQHWIQQRPRPFITDAIDRQADAVADQLADHVERALFRHGFRH